MQVGKDNVIIVEKIRKMLTFIGWLATFIQFLDAVRLDPFAKVYINQQPLHSTRLGKKKIYLPTKPAFHFYFLKQMQITT